MAILGPGVQRLRQAGHVDEDEVKCFQKHLTCVRWEHWEHVEARPRTSQTDGSFEEGLTFDRKPAVCADRRSWPAIARGTPSRSSGTSNAHCLV